MEVQVSQHELLEDKLHSLDNLRKASTRQAQQKATTFRGPRQAAFQMSSADSPAAHPGKQVHCMSAGRLPGRSE